LRQTAVFAADGEPLKLFLESLYSLFFSVYQTASIPQWPKLFYFLFCLQRRALYNFLSFNDNWYNFIQPKQMATF